MRPLTRTLQFLFLLLATTSYGQFSISTIDHNNAAAHLTDGGLLFNNSSNSQPGYEIPKSSGLHAIFASSFWYAGLDQNNQLHMSATRYSGGTEIFPGPYASPGMYSDPAYQNNYASSIWEIEQTDIDNHILGWNQAGYITPISIAQWPGNGDPSLGVATQLAPYTDLNNNGIYEPQLGEYPLIRGDKATYIIMNDAAQAHTQVITDSLEIEVHLMLYQFATNDYLNDITFINARIFNRGTTVYSDFRTSFYTDADLGDSHDDYFGSDSLNNLIYTYNGNPYDSDYGNTPPAIGVVSLNQNLAGTGYYTGTSSYPYTDPSTAAEYWNFMNNKWADGSDWVYGGLGYHGSFGATTTPTNFLMNGNPNQPSDWSEGHSNNYSGDRRMFMNLSQNTTFNPGEMICQDLAIIFGQGANNNESVNTLIDNTISAQAFFDSQAYDCRQATNSIEEATNVAFSIHPNPSEGLFTISFEEYQDNYSVEIIDVSGRHILDKQNQSSDHLTIQLNEPPGIYLLRITTNEASYTQRIQLH